MRDEVYKLPGPVLLLAGPGTGKTYQLAKRVKYLIEEEHIGPRNITVITFTVAAARSMREKISDPTDEKLYVPPEKQPGTICTMHSLGYKIIKEKADDIGLSKDMELVSDIVQQVLVSDAAQLSGFNRRHGLETARCRQVGNCKRTDERKCQICEQYKNLLRVCSAIDYDEQILLACKLLKEDAALIRQYQAHAEHLLVDEYQDINAGQFELIRLLSERQRKGLFVVGDDDQSIYSWRGGSADYIRNFNKDFGKEARVHQLERSYRCPRHIHQGAMAVVTRYDRNRCPKEEFEYIKGDGKQIRVHSVPSDEREAQIVARVTEEAIMRSRSVQILLPYRSFAKAIVEELRKSRIEYSAPLILPGQGLPLISILSKWLRDNSNSLAFRQCLEAFINKPDSGIPSALVRRPEKVQERDKVLLKIAGLWKYVLDGKANSFWDALELEKQNDELCLKFCSAFERVRSIAFQDDAGCFIHEVVKTIAPWKKPDGILKEIDLWVEAAMIGSGPGRPPRVQVMTLQTAKGLQADVVCVVGLEEGILPKGGEDIAEQSRIMFVAMTRAIEELHLFYARKRSQAKVYKQIYKRGEPSDIQKSKFIDAIPKEYREDIYHPAISANAPS